MLRTSSQNLEGILKAVLVAGWIGTTVVLVAFWRTGADRLTLYCWAVGWVMTLHQCEEQVFTQWVLGREGNFLVWLQSIGLTVSARKAMALNLGIAWPLGLAAGAAGPRWIAIPLFVITAEMVNAIWHLSTIARARRWSPGSLSGALATIPLGICLWHECLRQQNTSYGVLMLLVTFAILGHHAFIASLRAKRDRRIN